MIMKYMYKANVSSHMHISETQNNHRIVYKYCFIKYKLNKCSKNVVNNVDMSNLREP